MFGHQSQIPSTHQVPFERWLRKALRLNRSHYLSSPVWQRTDKSMEVGLDISYRIRSIAIAKA